MLLLRQREGPGVGRFQQKVLFAEHIAEHVVQALVHLVQHCSPRSARCLFVCVSMAFRDHNWEHASCLGSERWEMEKQKGLRTSPAGTGYGPSPREDISDMK